MVQILAAKRLIISLGLLSLATTVTARQTIVDQFERRSYTRSNYTLPYRLFVPVDYDSSMVYPLVLALHGAGERGSDNERQIQPHRLATLWADPGNQAANTTFVVAPQVPPNGRWTAGLPVVQSDFNDGGVDNTCDSRLARQRIQY